MHISKRLEELVKEREKAQTWFKDNQKRFISTNYDNREATSTRVLSIETFIAYFKALFNKEPISILDIGCGQGQTLEYLSNVCPNARLVGVDSSNSSIQYAKQQGIKAEFIHSDVESINFCASGDKFNVIFIHLCFGLFKDPIKVLNNVISQMSQESLIYIVDLNRESITEGLNTTTTYKENEYLMDQYSASLSEDEFKDLLAFVTQEADDLLFKIGGSGIGGFAPYSSDFISLISQKSLQDSLRTIVAEKNGDNTTEPAMMPNLIHAWLIRATNQD